MRKRLLCPAAGSSRCSLFIRMLSLKEFLEFDLSCHEPLAFRGKNDRNVGIWDICCIAVAAFASGSRLPVADFSDSCARPVSLALHRHVSDATN
jgi:hypothetical protein